MPGKSLRQGLKAREWQIMGAIDRRGETSFVDVLARCADLPLNRKWNGARISAVMVVAFGLAAIHPGPSAADGPVARLPETALPRYDPQPVPPARSLLTAAGPGQAGEEPNSQTYPLTLSGRALDEREKPISGARIFLASDLGDRKCLAEIVTDAEGRYAFRNVPLPIDRQNFAGGRDAGAFEVFGLAQGYGFTWRPAKWLYLRPSLASLDFSKAAEIDPPDRYEPGDKIELDLRFAKPAPLSGLITDVHGKPLPGVRVELQYCESFSAAGPFTGRELHALQQKDSVPEEMKLRITGADGRFAFAGLPSLCRFRVEIRPEKMTPRKIFAATSDLPQPDFQGQNVLTGDLKLVFPALRDVPVQVMLGETESPGGGVLVEGRVGDASSLATTDADGRAVLRLPPGRAQISATPRQGLDFLMAWDLFEIPEETVGLTTIRLRQAGVVDVTIVDADTGDGIPGIEVWKQTHPGDLRNPEGRRGPIELRAWDPKTRTIRHGTPPTDARGRVRILLEPGKHTIGAGRHSQVATYKPAERQGREVECVAGTAVPLQLAMWKIPAESNQDRNEPRKGGLKSARPGAALAALEKQTTVEFLDLPLEDALAFLAEDHHITIRQDEEALQAAGISLGARTVSLTIEGQPLRSIMKRMLEPDRLGYIVDTDGLVITTRERAEAAEKAKRKEN